MFGLETLKTCGMDDHGVRETLLATQNSHKCHFLKYKEGQLDSWIGPWMQFLSTTFGCIYTMLGASASDSESRNLLL